MSRLVPLALISLCSSPLYAGTSGILPGTMSTIGPSGNNQSLFSATHNPAMAAMTVSEKESWRMSYFSSIATNVELGDVNEFIDEVDELSDVLDDPSSSDLSVDETLAKFNSLLVKMGDEGYVKNSTSFYLPGFPLYWKPSFLRGTLMSEISIGTQEKISLIDGALSYDSSTNGFKTSTSAYLKTGIEKHFSLGYGQKLYDDYEFTRFSGELYAGVKMNLYAMDLSKQVFVLQYMKGDDIEEVIRDTYDRNLKSTTAVGIDAGLMWVSDRYNVGFTIENINSPKFEYGEVGRNCSDIQGSQSERDNCEATAAFIENTGEIKAKEVHVKSALASIDASYFIFHNWALSSSLDLASYDDIVGTQNQYFQISTSYTPKSIFLPSMRIGYQKNLVGSQLTTYGVGLSLLKTVSLDLSFSPDTVNYDGQSAPRKMSFSLSFEETF